MDQTTPQAGIGGGGATGTTTGVNRRPLPPATTFLNPGTLTRPQIRQRQWDWYWTKTPQGQLDLLNRQWQLGPYGGGSGIANARSNLGAWLAYLARNGLDAVSGTDTGDRISIPDEPPPPLTPIDIRDDLRYRRWR